MSKKCELTGKSPLKGHKVSHANNKVKRKFFPNLKNVTFKSDILKKNIKKNIFFINFFNQVVKGGERFYSLVKTVPIPKRLFFEENAEKTVQKKIRYIWTTQLNRALRTSKYR